MNLDAFLATVWPAVIFWFLVVIVAVIIEINTAQMLSIWFAVSGLVACILAGFGLEFWIQCLVFVLGSVILFFLSRPVARKINQEHTVVEGTAEGLADEIVTVTKAFNGEEIGEVKARYDYYSAISCDKESFEVGEKAKIVSIQGNKVIIKKTDLVKEN